MSPGSENAGTPAGALFPGQGVQREGRGRAWRDTPSWSLVETVSEASGHDVAALLLDTPTERLARTDFAQITVFTAALLSWFEFRRLRPDAAIGAFAGHSLGEYTALVAAGALTVADGARLVGERGRAMDRISRRSPGAMAAVTGADSGRVEEFVRELRENGADIWVANLNSPRQTVVAGSPTAIRDAAGPARAAGWRYQTLPVLAACHTAHMAPAARALEKALAKVRFAAEHRPVVANVDGASHTDGREWPTLCLRQLTHPVRWVDSLTTLESLGCRRLIDFGPGRTLAGLAHRTLPHLPAVSAPAPRSVAA
ncbi:ACP S-malonyltransferase [Streptomyces amakusaensis]|uniref:ACP S-malonyltransferase n=1 Tax=Streptomyces amakusaensis TaxID=67271 RepID=UPI0031E274E6